MSGTTGVPLASQLPLVLAMLGMSTVIMWFAAKVVGVREAGFGRALIATIGVSVVVAAAMTVMQPLFPVAKVAVGLLAFAGSVAIIRAVFRTKTFAAVLIWLVNVMVQMLIVAMYIRSLNLPRPATPPR